MTRRSLTTANRVAIFEASNGVCHICAQKIKVGETWEADHLIPRAITGSDNLKEYRPAHKTCHQIKTRTEDVPTIAKVARIKAKHIGADRKRSSFQTNRDGPFKRTMRGELIRRPT